MRVKREVNTLELSNSEVLTLAGAVEAAWESHHAEDRRGEVNPYDTLQEQFTKLKQAVLAGDTTLD